MTAPGRNEQCHCGSGRKYKKCHGPRETSGAARSRLLLILVGGAMIAALAVGIAQITMTSQSSGARTWDPVHGHFHDANGVEIP
jgi:hypothetical protein